MNIDAKGIWALAVAAGRGERLGLPYNKVLHPLFGRSVLSRCLDALSGAGCFEGIVLVLSPGDLDHYERLAVLEGPHPLVRHIALGGENRQQSVRNGLALLPPDARVVAIHDAARAFVPKEVVLQTVQSALERGNGVAATELTDTIKQVDEGDIATATLRRGQLRAVQTPQTFRVPLILSAHEKAERDGFTATDDAALVERYGGPVWLCCSPVGARNVKLTTMEDLTMMEARLAGNLRVGQGYDVHRLAAGRALVLCGVSVPFELGLLGYSDADVAAHALMDALLGACALGDIGRHFPDTDAQYEGADSMALLRRVSGLLREAGFAPHNVDVTIICERPKVAPFAEAMRGNLAQALCLPLEAVSVKATTTERLGFTGRGEGIAASAIATVTSAL